MHTFLTWNVDASQILTRGELARVLADLAKRAPRLPNVRTNLVRRAIASSVTIKMPTKAAADRANSFSSPI